jgi:hypothetical protein
MAAFSALRYPGDVVLSECVLIWSDGIISAAIVRALRRHTRGRCGYLCPARRPKARANCAAHKVRPASLPLTSYNRLSSLPATQQGLIDSYSTLTILLPWNATDASLG